MCKGYTQEGVGTHTVTMTRARSVRFCIYPRCLSPQCAKHHGKECSVLHVCWTCTQGLGKRMEMFAWELLYFCHWARSTPMPSPCDSALTESSQPWVSVSWGCYNNLPQAWRLTTTEISVLSRFWRPEVWDQGVGRAMLHPAVSGEESIPFLFHWLVATLLQSLLPLSPRLRLFCLWSNVPLLRNSQLHVGATWGIQDKLLHLKILSLITSVKSFLSYKTIFTGLGYEDTLSFFGGAGE